MILKEKLTDFLGDIRWYLRHFRVTTRSFFEGLGRWFSYYKVLRTAYDFDYSSILDVEKYQITRIRNHIDKHGNHVSYKEDVAKMDLALRLLDIIERDGDCQLIGKGFTINEEGFLINDPNSKWVCTVYVNTKNAKRFLDVVSMRQLDNPRTAGLMQSSLYVEKAWTLYHRVKARYMRNWWD
jgi:hypothetical protein